MEASNSLVPFIRFVNFLSIISPPNSQYRILPSADDLFIIVAKQRGYYRILMAIPSILQLSCLAVKNLAGLIAAGGYHPSAILGPRNGLNPICVFLGMPYLVGCILGVEDYQATGGVPAGQIPAIR